MFLLFLRLLLVIIIAFFIGKLISKLKLPSILGWLLTGMIFGPHALSLINQQLLDAEWYQIIVHILECSVGLMIGTELVWNKIKRSGKAIIITTLTQSLGTFFIVSLVFGIVFYFLNIPVYLAFIFGGIALATAPAPALSIVREFETTGPVTKTLIPMAALDDIIGCIVFFTTIAIVAGNLSAGNLPGYMIAIVILLPLVIGVVVGLFAGLILKKDRGNTMTLVSLTLMIIVASVVGLVFNTQVLPRPILNFMLIGMAFSATFSNMISETRLEQIMDVFNPILGIAMIVVILNLGAPLDYHLIFGAGIFTAIYIVTRAIGKYFGAYFGASISNSPETVKKYLGLTLLPHSGVSLVFTGIAVSVLATPAPECANIVQGTIAAAAVINEVIAVITAKKGFEWAGELKSTQNSDKNEAPHVIITISRQHGSGGREIAKRVSEELGIPFYDQKIINLAAEESNLDKSFFEHSETKNTGNLIHELFTDNSITIPITDRVYLHQANVIRNIASQSGCVIVGRCADTILADYPHLLRIFVYADVDKRKERTEKCYHESADDLEKLEKNRHLYYQHHTGKRFGDAQNYDLCLNSGSLGIDECVKTICSAYHNHTHA